MVSSWTLVFTKQARKDARKLSAAGLRPRAEGLLKILSEDPFQSPPSYEKLVGDLAGFYSRRINIQHRLVYQGAPDADHTDDSQNAEWLRGAIDAALETDEQYWRSRALEVRLRWRKAADDVKELEQSAAGWRRRFYRSSVRDTVGAVNRSVAGGARAKSTRAIRVASPARP